MWKGTAAILNEKPASTMTAPVTTSGSADEAARAPITSEYVRLPEAPKRRLNPKRSTAEDIALRRMYLAPASVDLPLAFSQAVSSTRGRVMSSSPTYSVTKSFDEASIIIPTTAKERREKNSDRNSCSADVNRSDMRDTRSAAARKTCLKKSARGSLR